MSASLFLECPYAGTKVAAIDSIALLTCHECTVAVSRSCHNTKTLTSEVSDTSSTVNLPRVAVHVVVSIPRRTMTD